jgi:hypothetical protein
MISRFASSRQLTRHEVKQRLGGFGESADDGRVGYFVAVEKHETDAFQFARGHERPPPKQLLNRVLPG